MRLFFTVTRWIMWAVSLVMLTLAGVLVWIGRHSVADLRSLVHHPVAHSS